MKIAPIILALVAGAAIGWFGRGMQEQSKPTERAPRRDRNDEERPVGMIEPDKTPGHSVVDQDKNGADSDNAGADNQDTTATTAGDEDKPTETAAAKIDLENDPIAKFINTQRHQWKGFASMQAKEKVKGLLAGLGFDAETVAQIEAAIVADVNRQMDVAVDMMIGTADLDPNAFASFMGMPSDLSTELEGKLGTYLDDAQVHSVRERVKGSYQKQLGAMADMQIGMMGLSDLTDDQRGRLKEIYTSRDMMADQFTQFASLTRDRTRLTEALKDDTSIDAAMRKNFEPIRRQVQDVLTPEQYKSYESFEDNMVMTARQQLKMMQGLLLPDEKSEK